MCKSINYEKIINFMWKNKKQLLIHINKYNM